MGRPRNTEDRREQIVRGMMRALVAHGYAGATMQHIAKAAALSPGVLHYHFDSKEAILLATLDAIAQTLRARMATYLTRHQATPWWHHDVQRELAAYIDAHVALDDAHDPLLIAAWAALGAEALHHEALRARYAQAVARDMDALRQLIARWLQLSASAQGAQPQPLTATLYAAIQGHYQLALTCPDAIPRGSASTSLMQLAHALLGPLPR